MERLRVNLIYFYFICTILSSTLSFAQESCNAEYALAGVYNGVMKHVCFANMESLNSTSDHYDTLKACSALYMIAGGLPRLWAHSMQNRHEMNVERARLKEFLDSNTKSRNNLNDYTKARLRLKALDQSFSYKIEDLNKKVVRRSLGRTGRLLRIPARIINMAGGHMFFAVSALSALDVKPTGCSEKIHRYVTHDDKCRLIPRLGSKTGQFLRLDKDRQMAIMKNNPQLCSYYQELANKLEESIDAISMPEVEQLSCKHDGTLEGMNVKWNNGDTSNIRLTNSGDIAFTSSTDRTKTYEVDIADSKLSSVIIKRPGFAVRSISPSILLEQENNPSNSNVMFTDDQKDMALSMRIHYATAILSEKIGDNCGLLTQNETSTQPASVSPSTGSPAGGVR